MNTAEQRVCQNCKQEFTIEPDDFSFYEQIHVPLPTWCPECRLIRRLVWRNERALYKRKCDLCGEMKILMYAPDAAYKAYCYQCWLSDKWSALEYGREYDFSKPFFEQFAGLLKEVPRPGVIKQGNQVESEYTNRVTDMRNCYLIFGTTVAEYCRYGVWLNNSRECMDGYNVQKSERCYECIDCFQCYHVAFSQESNNCSDSWFLVNCVNCQNCFGCVNLRNKKYHIFNKPYTKEEYQRIIAGYGLGSAIFVQGMQSRFDEFRKNLIVPALITHHSTRMSGNWIENSKNVSRSFTVINVEEGKYLYAILDAKDVMDYSFWGATAELVYEQINSGIQVANVQFGNECWNQVRDMQYVMNCHNSHDLFGCVGLKNSEYCILNKRYSKEEYEKLVPKIKEQMTRVPYTDKKGRTYRYGEFYPMELSPFAYNETLAQEYFPIHKGIADERGYPWRELDTKNYQITMDAMAIPDNVKDVPDAIIREVIGCEHKGRCNQQCTTAFRILPEELAMYKVARLPLPRLCPNCRHFERLKKRTPIKLWPRQCECAGRGSENGVYANLANTHPSHDPGAHCPNEFETSYAPDRPEIVYCLECYNAEVV
ncbi:MAG: hypothetical protein HY435_01855 [Candidatus Liptonbacteria bacterium]|nr:hypothetical protein [Candidatus Liptonbacteria bacterium]